MGGKGKGGRGQGRVTSRGGGQWAGGDGARSNRIAKERKTRGTGPKGERAKEGGVSGLQEKECGW